MALCFRSKHTTRISRQHGRSMHHCQSATSAWKPRHRTHPSFRILKAIFRKSVFYILDGIRSYITPSPLQEVGDVEAEFATMNLDEGKGVELDEFAAWLAAHSRNADGMAEDLE